ncbi:unnamed protein product, partial [Amoebophrya sp. A25]
VENSDESDGASGFGCASSRDTVPASTPSGRPAPKNWREISAKADGERIAPRRQKSMREAQAKAQTLKTIPEEGEGSAAFEDATPGAPKAGSRADGGLRRSAISGQEISAVKVRAPVGYKSGRAGNACALLVEDEAEPEATRKKKKVEGGEAASTATSSSSLPKRPGESMSTSINTRAAAELRSQLQNDGDVLGETWRIYLRTTLLVAVAWRRDTLEGEQYSSIIKKPAG